MVPNMMKNDCLLQLAKKWAHSVGNKKATFRLCHRGLGYSTADQICRGRYKSTPNGITAAVIAEEMAKDGFSLEDGKQAC